MQTELEILVEQAIWNFIKFQNCKNFQLYDITITLLLSQISTVPEEQIKYKKLMNTLAWFFFKLLVFEYIEDSETGMAFRLPGGYQWKIFVEVITISENYLLYATLQVPSLCEVTQENAEQHLEWIHNEIPIFRLLGKPLLVQKEMLVAITIYSYIVICSYM